MTFSIQQQQKKSIGCGLDYSCPTSVTTPTGQGVRLNQYQSSIRGKTKTNKRQRHTTIIPDHKFEWFDLDAIREVDSDTSSNDDSAIIIRHDFHAGLLFTTESQVLRKEMEVNVSNHSSVGIHDHKSNRRNFEFDLRFWANSDHHNKVRETPDEREFRERMEELEQEVNSDLASMSLSSSSLHCPSRSCSSISSSSLSNHGEVKNENNRDGSNRSFWASWVFEDDKIQ